MKSARSTPEDIDQYISGFPPDVREKLELVRRAIREAVPDALEAISYQIPSFVLNGALIYFAAFRNHIGLYPAPREQEEFREELAGYKGGKGTVQFPSSRPIPVDLIKRIVRFRAEANVQRAAGIRK